uniref:LOW QUALITY PROTEIN: uncharacterized protein LOC108048293 n=1 Tax=Drosophila rhopaloa TaxID=1041015 RepID=A0A6P4F1M7_DRORH
MQRPVWACTIKVSVAAMSEDRAPHSSPLFHPHEPIPLSLFPGKAVVYVHTSNAMYYSDLFCLPTKT